MTFVLGLTGSMGMGKSTTAGMFRAAGAPVQDADAVVHRLYAGPAAALVEEAFPGTTKDGVVDRAALSARVVGDREAIGRLEAIVHPLVAAERAAFLEDAVARGARLAVLDVPLLFETGGERHCDGVCVVTAPAAIQRARILARPGMDEAKLEGLLARQMPDAEKRARAHFLVDTSRGTAAAERQVRDIVRALAARESRRARAS